MTDDAHPDIESIVRDEPEGRKTELRLWLRLLSCANLVTAEIRQRLRVDFNMTLPRFDLLAQLYREPDGLRLGELSRRMMVSNGNLTGLVERLIEEGFVVREADPDDRRALVVRLTKAGSTAFRQLAASHEGWLKAMFADVDEAAIERMMEDLARLKRSVIAMSNPGDGGIADADAVRAQP